jgi:hypothetical protein
VADHYAQRVADYLPEILESSYLDGLTDRPLEQVRAMRDRCQAVEAGLSYARRLAHGRLDIIGGELARRREGGDPADMAALVERLPELLSDSGGEPRMARSPRRMERGEDADGVETGVDTAMEAELDAIVAVDGLAMLSELAEDGLQRLADGLVTFEQSVSSRRHQVHDRIDALQAEIARRYRDGEASFDSILG